MLGTALKNIHLGAAIVAGAGLIVAVQNGHYGAALGALGALLSALGTHYSLPAAADGPPAA